MMVILKLWKWYTNCLINHPLKTQVISSGILWGVGDITAQSITHATLKKHHSKSVISSGILWGVGDITAQSITHATLKKHHSKSDEDQKLKINWKRVAITSMFGFGFVGPVGHYWYEGLDRIIRHRLLLQPRSFRFVATKVAVDGLIFGPLDMFVFFSYMGLMTGKSVTQVKEDVKRDFLPALVVEGGAWPLLQVANFRYVPVRYQLLYVNVFCLLDSAFLSWVDQQENAQWKQWFTTKPPLKEPGQS